jgi:Meiotically up-regulated gene 113
LIYFIKSPSGPIKIGTTIRLSERLKQLAADHGEGLEVLAVVEGSYEAEKGLHDRFGHLRIVNEWFEPGDDLVGFIVAEGRPWDGTDDVPLDRPGTLVRVSDAFADALRKASALQSVSMADFADANLLAVVQKLYRDTLARESKRMGGDPK